MCIMTGERRFGAYSWREDYGEQTIHHYITFTAFCQILPSLLHESVSDKLMFRKLCSHCVPKLLTEEHKLKHQNFWNNTVRKVKTSWALQSQETRRCRMKSLNWSSNSWSGGTLYHQQRRNSSRPLQLGRSCAQCFGTEGVFCLMSSCLRAS